MLALGKEPRFGPEEVMRGLFRSEGGGREAIGIREVRANALSAMINFINRNAQQVIRAIQLSETDHRDRVYVLRCGHCGKEYAANGAEVWERLCPFCQGGAASPPVTDSGDK